MYLDQAFRLSRVSEKVALEISEETLIKFSFSDDNKCPILIHILKLQTSVFFM
jgi:hypothetical protein